MLELSIVLLVVGLVSAMGASMMQGTFESVHWGTTNMELNTIEDALMAYRTAYNRLPCPADPALLPTDANYGVEAANMGSCTGGTPAAPFADATHSVVEGAVPFKTLGIPESFMYDGWNRKFAYAVNQNVTAANAMQSEMLSDQCGISVSDASGVAGNRTTGAIYALVSFGPDGHGGYLKNGSRMDAGVTNTDEQTNCHCDASGTATTYAASYVEKDTSLDASDASHPFQDLVRFKERWQMMTTDDTYITSGAPVCSYGFRVDGMATNQNLGESLAVGDVNGDGITDLIFGQPNLQEAFVVFGTKTGFPNPLPLNSTQLNGSNGFTITGSYPMNLATGDVNGDGYTDIVLGEGGSVVVIFGHTGTWPATVPINAIRSPYTINGKSDGTYGFWMNATTSPERYSYSMLGVGDINGDGIADVSFDDAGNNKIYVVFGHANPWSGNFDPSTLADGTNGFYLNNRANQAYSGQPVVVADVNGDGEDDLLIGSSYGIDTVDVIFGHTGSWSAINGGTLGSLTTAQGTYFYEGVVTGWNLIGTTIAVADINNDGTPDILMGTPYTSYGSVASAGSVYVVPVGASFAWGSASYDVTALKTAGNAYAISGVQNVGSFAYRLTTGDFNGDGIKDIAISCPACTADNPDGSVYVVYGKSGALSDLDLAATPLNGSNGFRVDCSYAADAGYCGGGWGGGMIAAGDLNSDGLSDLMISNDQGTDANGDTLAGYTYVIYGSSQSGHFPSALALDRIK